MEPEGFPRYNEQETAAWNYTRLLNYLTLRDSALAQALTEERARLQALEVKLTKSRVRLFISHFRQEAERAAAALSGGEPYQYHRLSEAALRGHLVQGARTEAEQLQLLAAQAARIEALEQLNKLGMLELADLIRAFRAQGLVSDAQTDAIVQKVGSQCDALRDENRRLRQQLSLGTEAGVRVPGDDELRAALRTALGPETTAPQLDAAVQTVHTHLEVLHARLQRVRRQLTRAESERKVLDLASSDQEWQLQEQHNELAALREQLMGCAATQDQLALLQEMHRTLEHNAGEETQLVQQLQTSLLEEYELHRHKDAQIETLERDLSNARTQQKLRADAEHQLRFQYEEAQKQLRLLSTYEHVIEGLEREVDARDALIEDRKREVLHLTEKLAAAQPEALRREVEQTKAEYLDLYNESVREDQKYLEGLERQRDLAVDALEQLHRMPVYEWREGQAQPQPTGSVLSRYLDDRRPVVILDADSLGAGTRPVVTATTTATTTTDAHFMSVEEDSLRAALRAAARGQSGRYRVRLELPGEGVVLWVESLAPQRLAAFRALELVLDLERQPEKLRYEQQGPLPRRMLQAGDGELRAQRYDADRAVGAALQYRYSLHDVHGVAVVRFADGALLYATHVSASLYRLDLIVLPFQ